MCPATHNHKSLLTAALLAVAGMVSASAMITTLQRTPSNMDQEDDNHSLLPDSTVATTPDSDVDDEIDTGDYVVTDKPVDEKKARRNNDIKAEADPGNDEVVVPPLAPEDDKTKNLGKPDELPPFEADSLDAANADSLDERSPVAVAAEMDSVDTEGADSLALQKVPLIEHRVYVQHRGYKDHVALRWAPDSYVSWRQGLTYGYDIYRSDRTHNELDTMAMRLLPLSEQEFVARFGEADTMAMAAGELIYGVQPSFDGSLSINQIIEEQQGIYSFMMMICDLRPDVAEAAGLCLMDRTAKAGTEYSYVIEPCLNDSTFLWPGIASPAVRLGEYQPEPYPYAPVDSVVPPASVHLTFPRIWYSTYDIERRDVDLGQWQKLNPYPFMVGSDLRDDEGNPINIFNDAGVKPGTYEYRIKGRDLFGEVSEPGPVTRVEVKDMIPPTPPVVKTFIIMPGDSLMQIHIQKDSLEDDLRGYRAYYYNKDFGGDKWQLMEGQKFLPTDTVLTVNVKGLPTGNIRVGAYDQEGNEAYTMALPFHVLDKTPPQTPKNLRAAVSPEGIVVLFWSPSPDLDVHYYDVFYANDTTHTFRHMPRPMTRDTIAFDTLSLSVMQQYRYYQVQAVDWNGNESLRSDWLQVARPNYKAPQPCRIDSVWQDEDGVYSRWLPSPEPDIAEYRVMRRQRGDEKWRFIQILTPDSIRQDGKLYVSDTPKPDRNRNYQYCIESVNTTGTTSGASLYAQYLYTGPHKLPISIKVEASYRAEEDCVAVAWETKGLTEDYRKGGYYVVYRRLPGETEFREVVTTQLHTTSWHNQRFPKGADIEYRVIYRNEDTRYSPYSNIATVHTPAPEADNQ